MFAIVGLRVVALHLEPDRIGLLPGAALTLPFGALAISADREWPILLGQTLGESISAPIVAVIATVLFFDLRARRAQPFG